MAGGYGGRERPAKGIGFANSETARINYLLEGARND